MKTISIYLDAQMNLDVFMPCITQLVKKGYEVKTYYANTFCRVIKDEAQPRRSANTVRDRQPQMSFYF